MSSSSRTQYIKDAIRSYVNLGADVKLLNKRIEQLISGDIILNQQKQTAIKDSDFDILEASMVDLINL